jgi:hypothetical protein
MQQNSNGKKRKGANMILTKHQLYLVKEAQKAELERRITAFGRRMQIKKHGYPNCSCCPERGTR